MAYPIVSTQDGAEKSQQLIVDCGGSDVRVSGRITIPGDKSISHRAPNVRSDRSR